MKRLKYIIFAILWFAVVCAAAQRPVEFRRVEGGRKTSTEIDSVLLLADSVSRDSILLSRHLRDSIQKDSLDTIKYLADSIRKHKKFSILRDTLSPGVHFALSLVPGMGQIYNGQWWKAPIFVGLTGGFLAGGFVMGAKYESTAVKWDAAVRAKLPDDITKPLQKQMYDEQSAATIFYCLAGASYLYSLADATLNYRGHTNHVRKATMLAALFPGAGFFYTRTYWRIPIYYGGFVVMASVIDYNNRYYTRFKRAYDISQGPDPKSDEFGGRYTAEVLRNSRDAYRRDRDFGIIAVAAIYLLSVLDTYVSATLKNWDVSPDLSLRIEPTLFSEHLGYSQTLPSAAGLSLKLTF